MRKNVVLGLATSLLLVGAVQAKDSTGCGLGSMLFKDKQGTFNQVLAVTTNGTSGDQTFGISSGTLGCDPEGKIEYTAAVQQYMGERIDQIAADMSQGGGENLAALATLIGVAPEDRPAFFQLTKVNFTQIFPAEGVTAEQALLSLQALMSADARFHRYVS